MTNVTYTFAHVNPSGHIIQAERHVNSARVMIYDMNYSEI